MRKFMPVLILVMPLILFSGCRKEAEINIPKDYRNWKITADNLNYPIPGHESHFRRVFINSTGESPVINSVSGVDSYDYPDGTIVVKEVFSTLNPGEEEEPIALTVMIKDRENPVSRGGWIWVMEDLVAEKTNIIDYEFCFDCHLNANEPHQYGDRNPEGEFRDYLFFPYNPEKN